MSETQSGQGVRWGFIGAGRMASALVRGMLRSGAAAPGAIAACDPDPKARGELAAAAGIATFPAGGEVVEISDVVVLAVKPQNMGQALSAIAQVIDDRRLVISVAAGITLATIESELGRTKRIARVMSNTPALIGAGASAYCLGSGARETDEGLVRSCLESVGAAHRVPENLLDAVTGLSGSGPAFVYLMIEALADGGVRAGLPRSVALDLAVRTVQGAAGMVLETGLHPGELKDQVASPAGTTIAGLHELERAGVRGALMSAVVAASQRATELSRPG